VPTIEVIRPGSKQTITIKSAEAEREVIKIMREDRKRKGGHYYCDKFSAHSGHCANFKERTKEVK